jgi:peptide chain release factor 2
MISQQFCITPNCPPAQTQSVNKTESAVRLKHNPTGITIENSESRSQLENKTKAIQLLKSQLYELEIRKIQEEKEKLNINKKKIERGSNTRLLCQV